MAAAAPAPISNGGGGSASSLTPQPQQPLPSQHIPLTSSLDDEMREHQQMERMIAQQAATAAVAAVPVATSRRGAGGSKQRAAAARSHNAAAAAANGGAAAAMDAAAAGASTPAVAAAASHARKRGVASAVASLSVEEQQRLADQAHLLGTSVASIAKRTRRASSSHKASSDHAAADGGEGSSASASAADADAPFAFLAATRPLLQPEQERPIPKQRSRAILNVSAASEGSNGSADSGAAAVGAAPLPAATLSSALSALLPSQDDDDGSSSAGADAADKKNGGGARSTRKRKPSAKAAAAAAQAMKGAQDIRALFKQSPPAPDVPTTTSAAASSRKKGASSSSATDSDDFMEDAAAAGAAAAAASRPASAAADAASRTPPRSRSKLRGSTAGATPKRQSARHATPIVIDGDEASDAAASASASAPPLTTTAAAGLVRTSSVASLAPPATIVSPPSAARPVAALVADAAAAAVAASGRKGKGGRKRSRAAAAADDAESVASDATGSAVPILPPLFVAPGAVAPPFAATAFRSRSKAGAAAAELYFTPPSSTPSAASAAGTSSGSMSSLALSMGSSQSSDTAMFLAVTPAAAVAETAISAAALAAAHPDTLVVSIRTSARARKPTAVVDALALTPSKRRKRAVSPAPLAAESPVAVAAVSARKLALRSPLRPKVAATTEHKEPASPTASEATASSSAQGGSKGKARRNAKCCRPRGLQKQLHCSRCGVGHTIPCTGLGVHDIAEQLSTWLCKACNEPEHVGEVSVSPPQLPLGAQAPLALAVAASAATPAPATAAAAPRFSPGLPLVGSSTSPVSLTPAAASASPPVMVLRRPLMPLPLPIPSPGMEDDEQEEDPHPLAAAAPFVPPLAVMPQPRQPSLLQRSVSEQFESALTPRIAARSFEELLPASSAAAAAAAAARGQDRSEDAEMKSVGDADAHAVSAADELGSAAMPMVLDGDESEEEQGGLDGAAPSEEAERDEEEEAIASISTPAPLSPLSSAVAHEEGGSGRATQQQLQHRTLSTAITPPLSPAHEGFQLSQEDECETGPDALESHDPDLSMDSPDLSQYHLELTPPNPTANRGTATAPPSSATAAAAAAAAPSPLQPARAVSNVSHSSTLTRLSVQLNDEPHAAATAPSSAAAAVAPPVKLGRATRSPQTLQRAHATSSNQALQQQQQQPSPVRRPTRALAAAAASAAGSAVSKASKPLHYTMSDLMATSWHLAPTPSFPFDVHAAAATCQGWFRGKNQDAFICEAVRVSASFGGAGLQPPPLLILGVADGHGILGHLASAVCAARMPLLLKDCVLLQGQALEEAVTHAIAVCHAEINERAEQIRGVQPPAPGQADDDQDSSIAAFSAVPRRNGQGRVNSPSRSPIGGGTTAVLRNADFGTTIVMCVIQGTKMCVAHVGDSRCIILQRETPAADAAHSSSSSQETPGAVASFAASSAPWLQSFVTSDHNGEQSSERSRVRSEGGSLLDVKDPSGDHREYRVFPACMTLAEAREMSLTINMTRALGHIKLGVSGISAVPDVQSIELNPRAETCIILGSDGLTDMLNEDQLRDLVTPAQPDRVAESVRELLQVADSRWQARGQAGDNVTAVIARFRPAQ